MNSIRLNTEDIKTDELVRLGVFECYQCMRCSPGCPVREEMDYLPHQIIKLVQLGLIDEIYNSKTLWLCLSCETCYARCPMDVELPELMDKIRQRAEELTKAPAIKEIPIFDRLFLFTIRRVGRLFELGFMALYKLFSLHLFKDISRFPEMLFKDKFKLLPHFSEGRDEVRRVYKNIMEQDK